jgi:predicted AAA+ superfamily ATPase
MVSKKHYDRILEPAAGSFFLFGPRGTGKSTWLRARFPQAHMVDLLDESRYQRFLADPGLLAAEIRALPADRTVVLDEVQRLPNLLNEVHRTMEERGTRFVLCGSSARRLRAGGVNLLAGRAVQRSMHAFVPEELGEDFDLGDALRWGCLPIVTSSPDRRDTLEAYVQMYLSREVQAEALVRSLPGFARFLPVAALFHGQRLNVSGLARDAGVARSTVVGYLEILEDTLLCFRLPAYEARLRVRERKHPKLYMADAGIARALKRRFDEPAPEEIGHLIEGFVAQVLRAQRDYRRLFDEWFYWSSGSGGEVEVDFILRRGDDLAAVEVKSSAGRPAAAELRGLRAAAALGRMRRRILVYRGDRALATEDGIEILPAERFLEIAASGELW